MMIQNGSRAVTIRNNNGAFYAVSLCNFKDIVETATVLQGKSFATLAGAERWAKKQVA